MSSSFKLYKPNGEYPEDFIEVDEELCSFFGVEPNPTRFLLGWVDAIGQRVALGWTSNEIKEEFNKEVSKGDKYSPYYENLILVLDYLVEHYELEGSWMANI
jgi:hypothetical protein